MRRSSLVVVAAVLVWAISVLSAPRHLLKPRSLRVRQVSALEAVLVAAAERPPSNEDSPVRRSRLGGLRRSFVTRPPLSLNCKCGHGFPELVDTRRFVWTAVSTRTNDRE